MKYSLGIDTSNYKTSIALTNIDGDIVYDKRILLNVDKGKRGLRQQEALFSISIICRFFLMICLETLMHVI